MPGEVDDACQKSTSGARTAKLPAAKKKEILSVHAYATPTDLLDTSMLESFDFEEGHQPFVWTHDGHAVPLPRHKDSGYALGYDGSGPRAIKESAARLLGLSTKTKVGSRWPFLREGDPTRVATSEMLNFYDEGAEW